MNAINEFLGAIKAGATFWTLVLLAGVNVVAAQNDSFIRVEAPTLKIETAVRKFNRLKLSKEMVIMPVGTQPYEKDLDRSGEG